MRYLMILGLFTLTACTDAKVASVTAYGSAATVVCYSGGQVIYNGRSTGRVQATEQSDGWEFKDAGNGQFVRVSGDCVVTN